MDAKNALITGAYGFIGRNISHYLSRNGWDVIGIGHGNWSEQEWKSHGLTDWFSSEISQEALLSYGGNPDLVIHCAGSGSVAFSVEQPSKDYQKTVESTENVLEYIRQYSQESRLIYPSSAAVYGNANTYPIIEDSPISPISPYGEHKVIAENLCKDYSHNYGISCVVIRLFSVYGNGLKKQLLWDACEKISKNNAQFFGSGEEVRDWIHISDVVCLMEIAHQHASPACPVVNGCTGTGTSVKEILENLKHLLNYHGIISFSEKPKSGDPNILIGDTQKIQEWNFFPKKSIMQGLEEYVNWYLCEVND